MSNSEPQGVSSLQKEEQQSLEAQLNVENGYSLLIKSQYEDMNMNMKI